MGGVVFFFAPAAMTTCRRRRLGRSGRAWLNVQLLGVCSGGCVRKLTFVCVCPQIRTDSCWAWTHTVGKLGFPQSLLAAVPGRCGTGLASCIMWVARQAFLASVQCHARRTCPLPRDG